MRSRIRSRPTSSSPRRTVSRPSSQARATPRPARTGVELATSVRSRARQGRRDGQVRDRDRARQDHRRLQLRLGRRVRTRRSPTLGEDGAILDTGFAEDEHLARRRSVRAALRLGPVGHPHREGAVQASAVLSAARIGQHPRGEVRLALRPAAQPVHVRQRAGRARRGGGEAARGGARQLPGREGADAGGRGSASRTRSSTSS